MQYSEADDGPWNARTPRDCESALLTKHQRSFASSWNLRSSCKVLELLPKLDSCNNAHPITEEMGVTGNDLGPEAPELWITQAKDRVEGVA